ncbi:MAG: methylmalonyl Co-A mutase-associated GTPase MeaB [Proteobacteria bacterium]|nr:methylmalonyl Co-A mutase-associated GTPase MeaB [Pseudomonadota bacterium]
MIDHGATSREIKGWLKKIKDGDRSALSRAITLVESQNTDDQKMAMALFSEYYSKQMTSDLFQYAIRLGITGPPGAGKSTLIQELGLHWIAQGKKVAVLAIDPSSPVSGGSLMVDKTRMSKLASEPNSFIRPSPSSQALGGVSPKTREVMTLLDWAGFEVIIIESVGVGQSEKDIAAMVDHVTLLHIPGSGDVWQTLKKGVTEHADLICIHKADNPKDAKIKAAISAWQHITSRTVFGTSDQELLPHQPPSLLAVSAHKKYHIKELIDAIESQVAHKKWTGLRKQKLIAQAQRWHNDQIENTIIAHIKNTSAFQEAISEFQPTKHPVLSGYQASQVALKKLNLAQQGSSSHDPL